MRLKGRIALITGSTRFLSSQECSYINGTAIVADGGLTGYHPVGFPDLIAEMMKKKGS